MAQAGTVAVLLPGAFYFLRETQKPPIDALRKAGRAYGRGERLQSGYFTHDLAARRAQHGVHALSADARRGARRHHARRRAGVGFAAEAGTLEAGKIADFVLWNVERPAELAYGIGINPCHAVVKQGIARTPAELLA